MLHGFPATNAKLPHVGTIKDGYGVSRMLVLFDDSLEMDGEGPSGLAGVRSFVADAVVALIA